MPLIIILSTSHIQKLILQKKSHAIKNLSMSIIEQLGIFVKLLLIIILNTSHIKRIILRQNITCYKNVTNGKRCISEHFLDCYS